jgi:hypothetical protein
MSWAAAAAPNEVVQVSQDACLHRLMLVNIAILRTTNSLTLDSLTRKVKLVFHGQNFIFLLPGLLNSVPFRPEERTSTIVTTLSRRKALSILSTFPCSCC